MGRRCLAAVLFLVSLAVTAQVNDAGLWTSINIQKKITKKISFNFSEELRFNENISELGTAFTELGPEVRLAKGLALGATYRFIQKRNWDDSYSLRHRFNADLSYRLKWKDFSFSLRERYQVQYSDINSSETGTIPETTLRSKVTGKYKINKKFDASLSGELFNPLRGQEFRISDWRCAAGIQYETGKNSSLELFYLIDSELLETNPVTSYVTGIEFDLSF